MQKEAFQAFFAEYDVTNTKLAALVGCTPQLINKCRHKGLTRGAYLSSIERVVNFPEVHGIYRRSPESTGRKRVAIKTPPQPLLSVTPEERELARGHLSKDATFRLIVSGPVGPKEIDHLIERLRLEHKALSDN